MTSRECFRGGEPRDRFGAGQHASQPTDNAVIAHELSVRRTIRPGWAVVDPLDYLAGADNRWECRLPVHRITAVLNLICAI